MARIFEQSFLKEELAKVGMELLEPEYLIIHEEYDIICKNRFGNIITFTFTEVWESIYNENAIGCCGDCERCLTPIC